MFIEYKRGIPAKETVKGFVLFDRNTNSILSSGNSIFAFSTEKDALREWFSQSLNDVIEIPVSIEFLPPSLRKIQKQRKDTKKRSDIIRKSDRRVTKVGNK